MAMNEADFLLAKPDGLIQSFTHTFDTQLHHVFAAETRRVAHECTEMQIYFLNTCHHTKVGNVT
jgi:hypothetical protein